MSAELIKDVLRLGGNVIISCKGFSTEMIKDFARLAKSNNGNATFKDVEGLSNETIKDLARLGQSHSTIVFN